MLELAKEALDEVALAIDVGIDDTPDADVGLAWDVGFCPVGFDPLNDCPGKEAAIGDDIAGHRSAPERWVLSEAWPGVRTKRIGSPTASTTAWILVLSPSRERPMA